MAKATTKFVCSECGYEFPKWLGKCTNCGSFGTMIEEAIVVAPKSKSAPLRTQSSFSSLVPKTLDDIQESGYARISTGIKEFDTVLGGGVVPASLVLIGGDPGVGKSTILTQICATVSQKHSVLYVSAEESLSQVKLRCTRLGAASSPMHIVNETELEKIEELLNVMPYEFVVIDSIQAIYMSGLTSANGSVSQVRECASRLMRLAKSLNITIFIIGHVTKEGSIAGPKVLEHIMDTVLYFEGESAGTFKILRAVKNRFGSTNEVGILEMTEDGIRGVDSPSKILLSDAIGESAGSAVTPVIEGTRCMLVEIQSLTSPTTFGNPRRMSSGVDYNKFVLLLAVLEKKAGISLFNQDAYLNVMSGIRLVEPSIDLAVLLAVLSSVRNVPIRKDLAAFGEIGLTGEIRSVRDTEKRISECIKMGFKTILLPASCLKSIKQDVKNAIELIGLRYVWEVKKYVG